MSHYKSITLQKPGKEGKGESWYNVRSKSIKGRQMNQSESAKNADRTKTWGSGFKSVGEAETAAKKKSKTQTEGKGPMRKGGEPKKRIGNGKKKPSKKVTPKKKQTKKVKK